MVTALRPIVAFAGASRRLCVPAGMSNLSYRRNKCCSELPPVARTPDLRWPRPLGRMSSCRLLILMSLDNAPRCDGLCGMAATVVSVPGVSDGRCFTVMMLRDNPATALATCVGCAASWRGIGRAHCRACHVTFDDEVLFDAHRLTGICVPPGRLDLVAVGDVWCRLLGSSAHPNTPERGHACFSGSCEK
jgi:hypothetical protein